MIGEESKRYYVLIKGFNTYNIMEEKIALKNNDKQRVRIPKKDNMLNILQQK